MFSIHWLRHWFVVVCAAGVVPTINACSSSSGSGGGGPSLGDIQPFLEPNAATCASPGGPVIGPADTHCVGPGGVAIVQPTTMAGCYADAATGNAGGDDGGGAAAGDDGGGGNIGNCGQSAYGATMDGNVSADDDCKYNVMWTSTPICENQPVYFTVQVSRRDNDVPVSGANTRPDVVLNCVHPIPNTPKPRDPSPEVAPGVYIVGPIAFDMPGTWVVRFHFNENCFDFSPQSPHGHAAFYVQVP
jgi:hypothetical protein